MLVGTNNTQAFTVTGNNRDSISSSIQIMPGLTGTLTVEADYSFRLSWSEIQRHAINFKDLVSTDCHLASFGNKFSR